MSDFHPCVQFFLLNLLFRRISQKHRLLSSTTLGERGRFNIFIPTVVLQGHQSEHQENLEIF